MSTLDNFFDRSERQTQPLIPKKTSFPKVLPGAREYMDEMLAGVRILYKNSEWFPDKLVIKRWRAQARDLFNLKGYYRPGFLIWAVPFGCQQFKDQGKVLAFTGPMSFEYLWDHYPGFVLDTSMSYDEQMDALAEEDRRQYKEGWDNG